MTNTEKCNQLLDDIFCAGDEFNYELAKERLERWHKIEERISLLEYLNLLDALNKRHKTGHYRDSLIYKRAETSEQDRPLLDEMMNSED